MDHETPESSQGEGTTRRFFLGAAAGLTGAALAAASAHIEATPAAAVTSRPFQPAAFNLTIDGMQAGWLHAVEGGGATADVVLEKLGADGIIKKHLGPITFMDFDLRPNLPVSKLLGAEIDSMFQMTFDRFDGSVQMVDLNSKLIGERQFSNALVTEVGIPTLDAASKTQGFLAVKITPEHTQRVAPHPGTAPVFKNPKPFLVSNYKLAIDGLDCTRVTHIDAFTVKLAVQQGTIGDTRDIGIEPLFLQVPNLSITLPEGFAQTWFDWFDKFVIQGNNDDSQERNGTLTLLTVDLKLALATVGFSHLGIFALDSIDDGSSIRKVTAQLYCEKMTLKLATT